MLKISYLDSFKLYDLGEFIKFSKLVLDISLLNDKSGIDNKDLELCIPDFMPKRGFEFMNQFYLAFRAQSILPIVCEDLLEWGLYLQCDSIIKKYCIRNCKTPSLYTTDNEYLNEQLLFYYIRLHSGYNRDFIGLPNKSGPWNHFESNKKLDEAAMRIVENPRYADLRIDIHSVKPYRPGIHISNSPSSFSWKIPGTLTLEPVGLFAVNQTLTVSNKGPISTKIFGHGHACVGKNSVVDATKVDIRPFMKSFNKIFDSLYSARYILDTRVKYPYTFYSFDYRKYNRNCDSMDIIENIEDFKDQITTVEIRNPEDLVHKVCKLTNVTKIIINSAGNTKTLLCPTPFKEFKWDTYKVGLFSEWSEGVQIEDSERKVITLSNRNGKFSIERWQAIAKLEF